MGRIMNYPNKKLAPQKKDLSCSLDSGCMAGEALAELKIVLEINETLHHKIAEMERLALSDSLTSALNRRGIEMELQRVLAAAQRYNETGVLVFIDLDGFKPINDTYGHGAGDLVLQKVADLLRANIRPHDSVGRLGGDEFAVILSRTDWENGLARAEMLDRIINNSIVHWNRMPIAVRGSFGFERFDAKTNLDELMQMADEAMYKTKRIRSEEARIIAAENCDETRQISIVPIMTNGTNCRF